MSSFLPCRSRLISALPRWTVLLFRLACLVLPAECCPSCLASTPDLPRASYLAFPMSFRPSLVYLSCLARIDLLILSAQYSVPPPFSGYTSHSPAPPNPFCLVWAFCFFLANIVLCFRLSHTLSSSARSHAGWDLALWSGLPGPWLVVPEVALVTGSLLELRLLRQAILLPSTSPLHSSAL